MKTTVQFPEQTSALATNWPLQRKCDCGQHTIAGGECSSCSEERESMLQRSATNRWEGPKSGGVPAVVHEVLRSPGQPLTLAARNFFEPRFGQDFSGVRVHADAKAAESAQMLNALAYTVGHDVVFGAGQYSPGNTAGTELMAHELTHVVQQQQSFVQRAQRICSTDDAHEREADRVAKSIGSSPEAPLSLGAGPASANTLFRYRDPKSFNFNRIHTSTLKEEQFTDAKTQPWIEQVNVNYTGTKIDGNGDLAPSGEFEAIYHSNAAALPSFKANILGGAIVHGLTHAGDFKVTRIEGVGYNDVPLPADEGEGPHRKYSKALNASMHLAVFFHKGEALHGGDLNIGSHGCVHVPIQLELLQLNYHSVVDRTKVHVAYDSSALDPICCARMKLLGVTKKGGAANPCNSADPKACP